MALVGTEEFSALVKRVAHLEQREAEAIASARERLESLLALSVAEAEAERSLQTYHVLQASYDKGVADGEASERLERIALTVQEFFVRANGKRLSYLAALEKDRTLTLQRLRQIVGEDEPALAEPTPARILYRNHRGETAWRTITPLRVWFGATEWHPEPQYLLKAVDTEKGAERDFALRDVLRWGEGRDEPTTSPALASLAARVLADPEGASVEEVRRLAGCVLRQAGEGE